MKDNSNTTCKICKLSFQKKRADHAFCSKRCRDKDSYCNNKEKTKAAATARLINPKNRTAHNKSQLKWAHKNFNQRKNTALKHNYGITLEDYEIMFKNQEGKCFICNVLKEVLHVDHCHETDKVRGLLCGNCNKALGLLKDNISVLNKAIDYLRLHEKEKD